VAEVPGRIGREEEEEDINGMLAFLLALLLSSCWMAVAARALVYLIAASF